MGVGGGESGTHGDRNGAHCERPGPCRQKPVFVLAHHQTSVRIETPRAGGASAMKSPTSILFTRFFHQCRKFQYSMITNRFQKISFFIRTGNNGSELGYARKKSFLRAIENFGIEGLRIIVSSES